MTKRVFFLLGVIAGVLFAAVASRKRNERLKVLEAKEAHRQWMNAESEKSWQKELARMPFEKRMDYQLFEAGLKASNYEPEWAFEAEDDDDEEE